MLTGISETTLRFLPAGRLAGAEEYGLLPNNGSDLFVSEYSFDTGFPQLSVLRRSDPRWALIGAREEVDIENLYAPLRAGTNSPLVAAYLKRYLPVWSCSLLNCSDRDGLKKVASQDLDGWILPAAFFDKTRHPKLICRLLNPMAFFPEPGQGIQVVSGPSQMSAEFEFQNLHHPRTEAELTCERVYADLISGQDGILAFCLATALENGVSFIAGAISADGKLLFETSADGTPEEAAMRAATQINQQIGGARG